MNNESSIIEFPYDITLRDYQKDVWDAFHARKFRKFILVWHRRAGKDTVALNLLISEMVRNIGIYYHMLPESEQARKVIWEGIGANGKKFIDHFPKKLIKKINHSEMKIEFINGSIFRLCGANNYDSIVGSNPRGIILSEYSIQNPLAWKMFAPIIAENGGFVMFLYTPRGENHGYQLYKNNKNNPDFFTSLLTARDTKREDGTPVISEKVINSFVSSGELSKSEVAQEFYCDFTVPLQGAFFENEMDDVRKQERLTRVMIDPMLPVYTYWDMGYIDSMCIWFVQHFRNEVRCVHYYESSVEKLAHYVEYVNEFKKNNNIIYATHYGPHDIEIQSIQGDGESLKDKASYLGLQFDTVPRISKKEIAIEMARDILPRVWFDEESCQQGVSCLKNYRRRFNNVTKRFLDTPIHDWASHGADAFMTLAQADRRRQLDEKMVTGVIENKMSNWRH